MAQAAEAETAIPVDAETRSQPIPFIAFFSSSPLLLLAKTQKGARKVGGPTEPALIFLAAKRPI
jgi:hypothetical protein